MGVGVDLLEDEFGAEIAKILLGRLADSVFADAPFAGGSRITPDGMDALLIDRWQNPPRIVPETSAVRVTLRRGVIITTDWRVGNSPPDLVAEFFAGGRLIARVIVLIGTAEWLEVIGVLQARMLLTAIDLMAQSTGYAEQRYAAIAAYVLRDIAETHALSESL